MTNDNDLDFLSIIIEIERKNAEVTFNLNRFPMAVEKNAAKHSNFFVFFLFSKV